MRILLTLFVVICLAAFVAFGWFDTRGCPCGKCQMSFYVYVGAACLYGLWWASVIV